MAGVPPDDFAQRLALLEGRVAWLEQELAVVQQLQPPPPPPPPVGLPTTPASYVPRIESTQVTEPAPPRWTEQITTEIILKWAGLFLLFLAAVFLVSTAISRGWIGPELQLAGAVALGGTLVGLGIRPTVRIRSWAPSLISVGLAVLFTCAGAASEWLDLGGIGRGVLAAIAVGMIGVALARWVPSILVAYVTFVGLLVIPIWLDAIDEYGVAALAAFTLTLAIIFHALHVDRGWPTLFFVVTATLMIVQLAAVFDEESTTAIQLLLVATALAHWFAPVVHRLVNPESDAVVPRLVARIELAVPSWLWAATVILHDVDRGATMILIASAIAAVSVISALALRSRAPTWLWATQLLAGSVVLSVGLMAWLEGSTLLGALAVQAVAMLVLGENLADTWFRWQSLVTAALVLFAALLLTLAATEVDASWGSDAIHLLVFIATAAVGWYVRESGAGKALVLVAYGSVLAWVSSAFIHFEQGQFIISAVWAAAGVAVVVAGLGHRNTNVARVGLATLALVVGKLLTVDLAEIDTFWRAGLFFVIGLGFLWLSYEVPSLLAKDPARRDDN